MLKNLGLNINNRVLVQGPIPFLMLMVQISNVMMFNEIIPNHNIFGIHTLPPNHFMFLINLFNYVA
jgi:hypothetical protein